jgi:putative copper export protein
MKRIWIPQVIASVMLLWALNPQNPYAYYILLRWVCFAAFVYLALKAHAQGKEGWMWVLGVTAVIYNPIVPIHLTRGIWSAVNTGTLIIVVSSLFVIRSSPSPAQALLEPADSISCDEARNENPV